MSTMTDSGGNKNTKFNKVTSNIYLLQSDGGNIGVYYGKNETFMVDSQTLAEINNNLKIIKRVSKKPIKYLVNTGLHEDHITGNQKIKKEGALIFSSKSTRAGIRGKGNNDRKTFSGATSADITFSKKTTIYFNGEKVELIPVNNASSAGDVMVYFTKSNVLFTGDVFYEKNRYPKIDFKNGGSIDGIVSGLSLILKTANATTKIIPGHGGVANKSEVNGYSSMLSAVYEKVVSKRKNGNTLEQTLSSKSSITGRFDNKGYNKGTVKANDIITSIYNEIAKKMGPLDARTPQEKADARLKEMQKEKEAKRKKN